MSEKKKLTRPPSVPKAVREAWGTGGTGPGRVYTDEERRQVWGTVPASDYDALLAERDALREAGEKLAECVRPNALTRERLAAWRAATGEGA